MSWKNYFYFQKGDKTAIILLLILIVISGTAYILTRPKVDTEKQAVNPEFRKKFEDFQTNLATDSTHDDKSLANTEYPQYQRTNRYPYQQKLKQGETLELNSADTSALKMIPKIGSGFASRIVKYRESLGGYLHLEQLKEVWGMDDYLYNDIVPYITLSPKANKLKINSISFQELLKHPYINYKQAQVIIDIRERKDNISSINRLALLDEFSEKDIKRLTPYLSFD
ncbi:DNA uptake protein ComE-like DNA-binding protein [Dysgonomonas hofstadii]|uniref:DNA uptake protein ComE-like DNA-binding protein n=1 Tax=Dysgonomonas hofstadii TaxID=637886 RepID=A0A840CMW1_9BACT|nr:helix-hairpin-helix domain-containing protein [Dysgonomonas hofstadii]MBB4036451.1 DNA uptake protein ComE-like DNA-binding protein [Dysgonomonas hofstadii]